LLEVRLSIGDFEDENNFLDVLNQGNCWLTELLLTAQGEL
jgi:hypothetical protein